MHGQSCGEVDDAESLAVWYVLAAVSLCLVHGEVVEDSVAAILSLLVEGEERET